MNNQGVMLAAGLAIAVNILVVASMRYRKISIGIVGIAVIAVVLNTISVQAAILLGAAMICWAVMSR